MGPTKFETLSAEELSALSGAELAHGLNEIAEAIVDTMRLSRGAREKLADAKKTQLLDPTPVHKASVIDAQVVFDYTKDRARVLRELKSIAQTLLRAVP